MTNWKLVVVTEEPAGQEDTSGVYVVVHRVVVKDARGGIAGERITVRVDLMSSNGDDAVVCAMGTRKTGAFIAGTRGLHRL